MNTIIENLSYEFLSPQKKSFKQHQLKVAFLETLGELLGCSHTFSLGDGTIPDVIRINPNQDFLFIGDAKESETPGNIVTQQKLIGYLDWLKVFCQRQANTGVFTICYNRGNDISGWENFIRNYARNENIALHDIRTVVFSDDRVVTSFCLG